MKKIFLCALIFLLTPAITFSMASKKNPVRTHCGTFTHPLLTGYFSPTTLLSLDDLERLSALKKMDVINYAFADINNNQFKLSSMNKRNLVLLKNWLKIYNPKAKLIVSVGGWNSREDFQAFLTDFKKRRDFTTSAIKQLKKIDLDGIDIDWENEDIASQNEQHGLVNLFKEFRQKLPKNMCLTAAVPNTPQYYKNYPSPSQWHKDLDWVNLMSYDFYGTFGPYTELDSVMTPIRMKETTSNPYYPYPSTSIINALNYYQQEGLYKDQIVIGIPIYGHSYFTLSSKNYGLRQPVYDPNISSQIPYKILYEKYGIHSAPKHNKLLSYYQTQLADIREKSGNNTPMEAYWILRSIPPVFIPMTGLDQPIYQFISYEDPAALTEKTHYLIHHGYLGMSFWELTQDLPFENPHSLIRTMNQDAGLGIETQ